MLPAIRIAVELGPGPEVAEDREAHAPGDGQPAVVADLAAEQQTGQRFAFRVHAIGLSRPRLPGPIATWEYRFEPVGDGTRVTETWTDDRRAWPAFAANAFDRLVISGKTFAEFQVRNIETTLRNLKRELEQARTP
ncbi:SRPBCC family protein [Streptomyces sp. NPDC054844]